MFPKRCDGLVFETDAMELEGIDLNGIVDAVQRKYMKSIPP